jgi:hypothetical protein
MQGVDQERMLASISCPVIYLKANTVYGKDGVLYVANKDRHNIHFERPALFLSACRKLLVSSPQSAGV